MLSTFVMPLKIVLLLLDVERRIDNHFIKQYWTLETFLMTSDIKVRF